MSTGHLILIVEDEEIWQTVLKETLEDEGYKVLAASSYQDARQILKERSFDLVLLDLELDKSAPLLEGEPLLRWLSHSQSGTPCIVVSGQGDVQIVRDAFKQYQVVDFIAKDRRFDISTFVRTVREALRACGTDAESGLPLKRPDLEDGGQEKTGSRRKRMAQLLQILATRFDQGELRTLCFHLDVDYENLPGEGKANKARELVKYLDRRDRVDVLVKVGRQLRPDVPWEQGRDDLCSCDSDKE